MGLYGYYKVDEATRPEHSYNDYQPASRPSLPHRRVAGEPKPTEYDPNCQKPQNQSDSDLCAQWSAVKAVNESNQLVRVGILLSFLLGGIGIIATGVGTVLVYRSLRQTEEGLNIARTSMKMEQRAWIRYDIEADHGPYIDEDGCWRFSMRGTIANIGNSPAREFRYWPVICLDDPETVMNQELAALRPQRVQLSGTGSIIFPGEDHPIIFTINLDPDRAEVIENSPKGERYFTVFLIMIAEYETTFDKDKHYTARIYRVLRNDRWDGQISFDRPNYSKDSLLVRRYGEGPGYAD